MDERTALLADPRPAPFSRKRTCVACKAHRRCSVCACVSVCVCMCERVRERKRGRDPPIGATAALPHSARLRAALRSSALVLHIEKSRFFIYLFIFYPSSLRPHTLPCSSTTPSFLVAPPQAETDLRSSPSEETEMCFSPSAERTSAANQATAGRLSHETRGDADVRRRAGRF